jgi:hypothetical protein
VLYDTIIGLPVDARRGVMALLADAHRSEMPRAKARIVACRHAFDQWQAAVDRRDTEAELLGEMGQGRGQGREEKDGREAGPQGAEEEEERGKSGEKAVKSAGVGAEECALRDRYEVAKARVVHFSAFEFRPEWRRERERRKGREGEGMDGPPGSGE